MNTDTARRPHGLNFKSDCGKIVLVKFYVLIWLGIFTVPVLEIRVWLYVQ